MGLDEAFINQLLQEDQQRESAPRGTRPKADPTELRTLQNWFKLPTHICVPDCEHRANAPNGRACWNPDCEDPRPITDRGVNIVLEVKGQFVCRYCFLAGYLK